MKGWGAAEQRAWVRGRRAGYTAFGTVCLVLQLVPVLSMVFLMTSAVGSALWVSAVEERARLEAGEGVDGEDAEGEGEGEYRDQV